MEYRRPKEAAAVASGKGRRSDPDRSATEATREDMTEEQRVQAYGLWFNSLRIATYHDYREAFFDRWHRVTMFVVVLSGTAAATSLINSANNTTVGWIVLIPTVLSALDLVIGFSAKARQHNDLARRATDLHAKIDYDSFSDAELDAWNHEIIMISKDRPHHLRALDVLCHNELCRALETESDLRYVSPLQRRLRNYFSFPDAAFPRVKTD